MGENPNPHPRCDRCERKLPERRLNTLHYVSEKYKQGEESCLICETLQRCIEEIRVSLQINTETLPLLDEFPFLGRTIVYNSSDWSAV